MKVLVIGLGSIGKKHINALRDIDPSVSVFALRSGTNEEDMEGVTNCTSVSEAPADCDFVIISNPTFLHKETIERVLPLKKPLFIEKPLLLELDGADELAKKVLDAGVLTYIGCNLRFMPCVAFLRGWLQSEKPKILSLTAYCGSNVTLWQPGRDFGSSFRKNKEHSGGVHLELIHEMDYVTWMLGMPTSTTKELKHVSAIEMTAYDYAHYDLTYPSFTASITLDYFRPEPKRTCKIVTDTGTITMDLLASTVKQGSNVLYNGTDTMLQTYTAQMRYFLDHMRTGEPMMNNFSEALSTLRLALQ